MHKVQKKTTHTLARNHEDGDKSSIQTTQPIRASTVEHVRKKEGENPALTISSLAGTVGETPGHPAGTERKQALLNESRAVRRQSHHKQTQAPPYLVALGPLP